ncbi:DUF4190 domain-containing protein [Candidatus Woesearchaeota archaeon]|nr:DUF4190 domain-containing protein [Candidatus Woesearchaeota archaeon]
MAKKKAKKQTKPVAKAEAKQVRGLRQDKTPALSVAAFLFSLLGFVFSWILNFGWALSLLGIIFASVSMKKDRNKGLAITSLIIGVLGLVIWLLLFLYRPFSTI